MGNNSYGQLGNTGVGGNTNKQIQIVSSNVTAVAAGYYCTLFTESDGSLWVMGANLEGGLGNGTSNSASTPERIVNGGVTAIAAGFYHNLFLTSDGSLWGMGGNNIGQLGISNTANQLLPIEIVGPIVWNGGFQLRRHWFQLCSLRRLWRSNGPERRSLLSFSNVEHPAGHKLSALLLVELRWRQPESV
jgi:hypothetical protein